MYRAMRIYDVLERVHRARGFDPAGGITPFELANYCDAVNRWLVKAWEAGNWPQLRTVERRTFHEPWTQERAFADGDTVWYKGMHFASIINNNTGLAPDGDEGYFWVPAPASARRLIALSQPWARTDIDPAGFDLNAFMYIDDPAVNPAARAVPCQLFGDCIAAPDSALLPENRPWCVFRPAPPRFTAQVWDAGRGYRAGEVVYSAERGECFAADIPNEGMDPAASNGVWMAVGFPAMFEDYCVLGAVSDMQNEDEGKYRTRELAEREMERVAHAHLAGIGAGGRGRNRRTRR